MLSKIKSLIKVARSLVTKETDKRRFIEVTYQGKKIRALDITPYGFFHNTPSGGLALVFSQNGQESNAFAIVDDPDNRTVKNTKPGECGLQNDLSGSIIHLKENGDIDVSSSNNVNVNAKSVNVFATEDVNITASRNATVSASKDINISADANVNISAVGNVSITATGNLTLSATGSLSISFGGISMTSNGTDLVISGGGLEITGGSLTVNGLDFETHIHSQGTDSRGDTQQDTGQPHV